MNPNYFELFNLPVRFELDLDQLELAWREASVKVHPDRFATASAAEKRVTMQWASQINHAYQTLKKPLTRAVYLCELAGKDVESESNTSMEPAFLMAQMQWREELEDAGHQQEALQSLLQKVDLEKNALQQKLAELIDQQQEWEGAVKKTRELMFTDKIRHEIKALID